MSKSVTVLFNIEDQDIPNLNPLKKLVGRKYPDVDVDFRRIGPRDVAKYIGGMGACGIETALLLDLPDRVQPDLDPHGQSPGHLAGPV